MKRRNSIFRILLFLTLITFFTGIVYWVITNNLFTIKRTNVNLVSVNCVTEDQVRDKISLLGQNILFFQNTADANKLKDEFLCIKSVDIETHFPNRAVVNVEGRIPVINVSANFTASPSATLATPSATAMFALGLNLDESFLTDIEGVLFIKEFKQELPRVYFTNQKFSLGYKIDKNTIDPLVQIINKLKELGIAVDQVSIEGDLVSLGNKPLLIFSTKRDVKTQVASLQLILEKAKIESKDLELVDVRFEKPIIKYAPVNKR